MLRNAVWYLFTDVSGQRICPIFKGQISMFCSSSQKFKWHRNIKYIPKENWQTINHTVDSLDADVLKAPLKLHVNKYRHTLSCTELWANVYMQFVKHWIEYKETCGCFTCGELKRYLEIPSFKFLYSSYYRKWLTQLTTENKSFQKGTDKQNLMSFRNYFFLITYSLLRVQYLSLANSVADL